MLTKISDKLWIDIESIKIIVFEYSGACVSFKESSEVQYINDELTINSLLKYLKNDKSIKEIIYPYGELGSIRIKDAGLTVRTINVLLSENFHTLADIYNHPEFRCMHDFLVHMLKTTNFGKKSYREVDSVFKERGYDKDKYFDKVYGNPK